MTDFNTLELHIDPRGVATLWLNRADKHNAFNAEMIAELIQGIEPSLPLEPYAPDRHKHEPDRQPWLHPE